MTLAPNFEWFLPTWYGDIRLKVVDAAHTQVEVTSLTRGELEALRALKERSIRKGLIKRPWATEKVWAAMPDEAFVVGSTDRHRVVLKAPILAVERFLTQHLRGRQDTVSVIITDQGNLYEIKVSETEDLDEETNVHPFRRPVLVQGGEEPVAATTVRRPEVGCPAPDFEDAHHRATEVLRRFLTPPQLRDYEKHQRFMSEGADTGHRYVITSRHARSALTTHFRTVYDIDEKRAYCVHDWGVPAPEEMLTMHLLLSLPGWEGRIRELPELNKDGEDSGIFVRHPSTVLEAPPAHFYYDLNGCLRPFVDYEGEVLGKDGAVRTLRKA